MLLEFANACAWKATDPVLLELAGLTVASLAHYFASDHFDERERECLRFVEQFVIDVSGVTDADRSGLQRVLGDETERFVTSLYITEFSQRLEMISSLLFGEAGPESATLRGAGSPDVAPRLALADYQDAVVRGNALDPVLTEMVRLRCARAHNCRICQTLRLVDALVAGADEEMAAKIDFYEKSDLSERTKAALRVTDAFITRPDALNAASVSEARSMFSGEELAGDGKVAGFAARADALQ